MIDNISDYIMIRYFNLRNKLKELLGNKCLECGSINELQFHHKHDKLFDLSQIHSEDEMIKESQKCILLCKKCHTNKHRVKDHGTLNMYQRYKCRCKLCRKANSESSRKLKQKKRDLIRNDGIRNSPGIVA